MTVSELQPQLAEYFGVKDGVLVNDGDGRSAAAKAGVKAGDVITTLNGTAVTLARGAAAARRALDDGEELSLGVMRDKKAMTLKGKVEGVSPRRRTTTVL